LLIDSGEADGFLFYVSRPRRELHVLVPRRGCCLTLP
jgi:hypothetical protein